jgi:hypothetical protein
VAEIGAMALWKSEKVAGTCPAIRVTQPWPHLLRSLRRALTSASKVVGLAAINLPVVRHEHGADLIEICSEQVSVR